MEHPATPTFGIALTQVPATRPVSVATTQVPVTRRARLPTVQALVQPSATSRSLPVSAVGCQTPRNDYTRTLINGSHRINARTLWMLRQAQQLYGGPGSLLQVVQGSYSTSVTASFGTHAGGGAVDISLRNPANANQVLYGEADRMVAALRRAGFAAWYRPPGILGPDSGAHIHAIGIGDRELSPAARRQLDGPEGYFRGLDGLPPPYGPHPDAHGGPVVCGWMIELGFSDLR